MSCNLSNGLSIFPVVDLYVVGIPKVRRFSAKEMSDLQLRCHLNVTYLTNLATLPSKSKLEDFRWLSPVKCDGTNRHYPMETE